MPLPPFHRDHGREFVHGDLDIGRPLVVITAADQEPAADPHVKAGLDGQHRNQRPTAELHRRGQPVGGQRHPGDPIEIGSGQLTVRPRDAQPGRRRHPAVNTGRVAHDREQIFERTPFRDRGQQLAVPAEGDGQQPAPLVAVPARDDLSDLAERHIHRHRQQRDAGLPAGRHEIVRHRAPRGFAGGDGRDTTLDGRTDEHVAVIRSAPPHQSGEHERVRAQVARGVAQVRREHRGELPVERLRPGQQSQPEIRVIDQLTQPHLEDPTTQAVRASGDSCRRS